MNARLAEAGVFLDVERSGLSHCSSAVLFIKLCQVRIRSKKVPGVMGHADKDRGTQHH
jgi:hypothetical protein